MSLKELLRRDLSTFINGDEFAEKIDFNGVEVEAVVTENSAASPSAYTTRKQINPSRHLKLRGEFLTLYIKTADLPNLPKYGDFITVNGKRYKAQTVVINLEGICRITASTDIDAGNIPRPKLERNDF